MIQTFFLKIMKLYIFRGVADSLSKKEPMIASSLKQYWCLDNHTGNAMKSDCLFKTKLHVYEKRKETYKTLCAIEMILCAIEIILCAIKMI